jgi:hypothetical protein
MVARPRNPLPGTVHTLVAPTQQGFYPATVTPGLLIRPEARQEPRISPGFRFLIISQVPPSHPDQEWRPRDMARPVR